VYEKTGEIKSAQTMLDSAISEIEGIVIPDLSWRLLRLRGRLLVGSGKITEALSDFQKAVTVVEESRGELKVEAFQQGFFDDKSDLYEDAIRLLLQMQKPGEAFRLAESAKSHDFVDLLANQSIAFPEAQDAFFKKERQAYQAFQEAQDQLSKSVSIQGGASADSANLKDYWTQELENRRREHQQILAEIQTADPELASFVSVDPWDVGKIQSLLPDSAAVVEYFTSRNGLVVWVIRKTSLRWKQVVFPLQELEDHVRQLREAILSRLSTDLETKVLHQWLIEPVGAELSGLRHLVVVPHGILHYLPFTALENGQGESLMERFTVSIAPSATVLGFCMEKSLRLKSRSGGRDDVLAMGNPDLGDARYDLPFAEKEIKALRRTFTDVTAMIGKDATLQAVEQKSPVASGVLHFACHAEYSAETPLHSALRLAPEAGDDGRLTAQEIFSLPLSCRLVTLSACETGLAKATQGDEIVGLARSFIFAGTPSVIASLWKVDDLATAVLMKRFYRYLKAGYSKAEALRKAQVLVKNAVNAHPSAWAAFGLTGDFQ
jgi:CHAT domain-containing protein